MPTRFATPGPLSKIALIEVHHTGDFAGTDQPAAAGVLRVPKLSVVDDKELPPCSGAGGSLWRQARSPSVTALLLGGKTLAL